MIIITAITTKRIKRLKNITWLTSTLVQSTARLDT